MRAWTALRLIKDWLRSSSKDDRAGYLLAERCTHLFHPRYRFSEYGRTWLDDAEFFNFYENFPGFENYHSANRKYFLRELLKLVLQIPGGSAECGVFHGASSHLICNALQSTGKPHHLFDSFEGLSDPRSEDGSHWQAGQFAVSEETVRQNLASFTNLHYHVGWIPQTFAAVQNETFCFVHLDVDLYQPTRDAAEFFYPRLQTGGILLCDDYGFSTCPGAQRAFDELAAAIPEPIVRVPTGQAFLIKT